MVMKSLLAAILACCCAVSNSARQPNVLVIIADDLGIGDLGCYGNTSFSTPHIDRLASEGVQLMHHVAAAAVCTPSRTALLTGRYPVRTGMQEAHRGPPVVINVFGRSGLPQSETTFARALADAGYHTQLVGKWHQGWSCEEWDDQCHGPLQHGFQSFFGLPFTLVGGDFPDFELRRQRSEPFLHHVLPTVQRPEAATHAAALWRLWLEMVRESYYTADAEGRRREWWGHTNLLNRFMNHMLVRDRELVLWPYQLTGLTQRLLDESISFIAAERDAPFLLVHSFLHVHTPLFTAPKFSGASKHSRYADNVVEMDWAVGELLAALDKTGVADNTIVHFVSDHGGQLELVGRDGEREGGCNRPFSGGKGQGGMEGGIRVPAVFRWPAVLPAGRRVEVPTSALDLLPTLLEAAGVSAGSLTLDGLSLLPTLRGQAGARHHQFLFHHCGTDVHAVRYAPDDDAAVYKLHLWQPHYAHPSVQHCSGHLCACHGDDVVALDPPRLYEVTTDPAEAAPIGADTARYRQLAPLMLAALEEHLSRVPAATPQGESFEKVAPLPELVPWRQLHRFRGVHFNMSGLEDWYDYLGSSCVARGECHEA